MEAQVNTSGHLVLELMMELHLLLLLVATVLVLLHQFPIQTLSLDPISIVRVVIVNHMTELCITCQTLCGMVLTALKATLVVLTPTYHGSTESKI